MSAQHAALYRPLEGDKAIRFIELLPGKPSNVISINFIYDTLLMRPAPTYEATSYTWGSPNPTKTILCDGIDFDYRIDLACSGWTASASTKQTRSNAPSKSR
ncbi:hypothetical protein CKM354_000888600 [Cercospora kikuchii]|uniref:Heterokaryon incompatibility domain-containing protein n=1 Tax=Cercospora kikuchii TaxID=84275 RepID=A0A9P3CM40_9PEZI|nr:uncharacterized protein CKM354_000888600 [Cercospora kikuchii]GIZ45732.1 hypothetical protein CKM354_000888600 [Cercospora kikuchii]